ncbi:MAG: hypothetical protein V4736_05355, partial [Bdellovibrionota bacterium]
MKYIQLLLLIFVSSSVPGFSQQQQDNTPPPATANVAPGKDPAYRPASAYDESCRIADDRYEVPARVSEFSHKYRGMCVDTRLMRYVRVIKKTDNHIRIANFQHDGRFWIADIPMLPQAWDKVIFHTVIFPSVPGINAAHVQLRFKLNRGYKIYLRSQDTRNSQVVISDLIITSQTARIKDAADNMLLGSYDNFPIVTRAISIKQRQLDSANTINQYKLNLLKSEIPLLVENGFRESEKKGFATFYNILRPNCATEIFDLLGTLPRFQQRKQTFYTVLSADPVAGPSIQALEQRGIMGGRIADLADELAGRTAIAKDPIQNKVFSYFRNPVGNPYAFLVVEPKTNINIDHIRASLRKVAERGMIALPQIVQSMGVASLIKSNPKEVLVESLSQVHRDLLGYLKSINQSLPQQPVNMMIYLVPWRKDLARMNLVQHGVPAELPFALQHLQQVNPTSLQGVLNNVT